MLNQANLTKMEKIFKTIGLFLKSGMGIDFFESRSSKGFLKTLLCIFIHVFSLILQAYYLISDLNENSIETFLLYCTLPGTLAIFVQYLQLWYNKQRFCEFIDWVRICYLRRKPLLVDDLSKTYFQALPPKMRQYSV